MVNFWYEPALEVWDKWKLSKRLMHNSWIIFCPPAAQKEITMKQGPFKKGLRYGSDK